MNQVLQKRSSQLSFLRNARPAVPGLEKYLGGRILSPDRRDSYETHLRPKHVAPTDNATQAGLKCPSSQRLVTRKCDCPLITANNSPDSAFFFFETTMNFETCDGNHSHQLIVLRKQNPSTLEAARTLREEETGMQPIQAWSLYQACTQCI